MSANAKDTDLVFITQLINLVREYDILYNKKHAFYYNRLKKKEAWDEIAAQTNRTHAECKNKWTALREKFVRQLKKGDEPCGSLSADESRWTFYDEMSFLTSSSIPRKSKHRELVAKTYSPPSSPIDHKNPLLYSDDSNPPPLKQRKKSYDGYCDKSGQEGYKFEERYVESSDNDADELFLRTVLTMMKDLPSSAKDDIKADLFSKIIEMRRKYRDQCN